MYYNKLTLILLVVVFNSLGDRCMSYSSRQAQVSVPATTKVSSI